MRLTESSASMEAFGSNAVVAVVDPAGLPTARGVLEQTVQAFDQACSRFNEDSELSMLNRAAGRSVQVSALLLDAITVALRAARLTDGDVDPTVGKALIALGYDRDFALMGGPAGNGGSGSARRGGPTIVSVPGWRTIEFDPEERTVRLARGVSLDLGATAKALAADRAAADASAAAGCGVLVSLGGDVAMAGTPPSDGWRVRVTDDHRSGVDAPGQWITLHSGGLATSSTTARMWSAGGRPVHHLLDPATGRPAPVLWRTVSVAAASCLDANIASTAAIIRGQRAVGWLESLGLPSRLVSAGGAAAHVAGWPAEGDDLAARSAGGGVAA